MVESEIRPTMNKQNSKENIPKNSRSFLECRYSYDFCLKFNQSVVKYSKKEISKIY